MLSQVPIPSNAFSGGAVKFDLSPVDRMLMLQQQIGIRNQARQYAITKHFDQVSKGVMAQGNGVDAARYNDQGLPDYNNGKGDKDEYMARVQKWQQHAISNRAQIANPMLDGGQAETENERLYNETMDYADRSKQKIKNYNAAQAQIQEMQKKGIQPTDETLNALHRASLPLSHKDYQPIDLNSVAFKPKPWGLDDEAKLKGVLMRIKPLAEPDGEPVVSNGKQTQNFKPSYKDGGDAMMYEMGRQLYSEHAGFKNVVDGAMKDPNMFSGLDKIYQEHYGHPIKDEYDMATAIVLSKNPNNVIQPKTSNLSPYSTQAQAMKMQNAQTNAGIQLNKENAHSAFTNSLPPKGSSGQQQPTFTDKLFDAAKENKAQSFTSEPGVNYHKVPMTDDMKLKLAHYDPVLKKKIPPNEVFISSDGSRVRPVFYSGDANSKGDRPIIPELSKSLPRSVFDETLNPKKAQSTQGAAPAAGKPKAVKQNGIIYHLNEKTGQYE